MIAGEACVGGVAGKQVDRAGMGDEWPGAIVELGHYLDGQQPESGAQPSGNRGAAHGREPMWRAKRNRTTSEEEVQRLRGVYVGQQRILDWIVVVQEAVERVNDRPVHRVAFSHRVRTYASPRRSPGIVYILRREGAPALISHHTIMLSQGKHDSPARRVRDGLASTFAGEAVNDRPQSLWPLIGAFLRRHNDRIDDGRREDPYAYAPKMVGSRASEDAGSGGRRCPMMAARCEHLHVSTLPASMKKGERSRPSHVVRSAAGGADPFTKARTLRGPSPRRRAAGLSRQ
jgi:hypothetical protein